METIQDALADIANAFSKHRSQTIPNNKDKYADYCNALDDNPTLVAQAFASGLFLKTDREVRMANTIPLRMAEVRTIPLHVRMRLSIEFLRAEVSKNYRLPFAIVRYSLSGSEQKDGLRLDLDKQVFLDRPFKDEAINKELDEAARDIVEYLSAISKSEKIA